MTGSLCRKGEACTENQKKAVKKTNGPIIIVAGPGAGKTRVLVERVAYLVKRKHVPPENILVITFTEKAADELKARLLNCVGLDAELMHISTVHSFCSTILKNHPEDHEYGGGFEVLDEESQLIFLRANFYRLGLNRHVKMRDVPEVMEFFNMCTENCVDPERLLEKVDRKYRGLCQCYRDYLELLKSGKKIDFPCLEKEAWMLLKSSSRVLESVREKYRYMMIDEYQDTSPLQERIFRTIAGKNSNICVVGDEDQSIYGFRGATPENFIRFKDEFHADLVFLEDNFRSRAGIILTVDRFMRDERHYPRTIKPRRDGGTDVLILKSRDVSSEARNVVSLIKKFRESGKIRDYGYVAVLFRSVRYHADRVLAELRREGIPYTVRGDGSFLRRYEIRTMLYFLAYVDPPDYSGRFRNWKNWWNLSRFRDEFMDLSSRSLKALEGLERECRLQDFRSMDELMSAGIEEDDARKMLGINRLRDEIEKGSLTLLDVFYRILDVTGYLRRLIEEGSDTSRSKIFNLAKLSSIIDKYEAINHRARIQDLLWYLYLLPSHLNHDEAILEDPASVKVMTVHQAKGLEFPVVFICSVIKNRFPGRKRKKRELVPIPRELLLSAGEEGDEDRRLFYVAMTRAQDALIISTASRINTQNVGFSPYIHELREKCGVYECDCSSIKECLARERTEEPLRINFSALFTYEECPFRYMMIYHYGFVYPESFMQRYGIILHRCLEELHNAIKASEEIDGARIREIVESCWIPIDGEDDVRKSRLARELLNYYRDSRDYINEVVSVEESFSIPRDDVIIEGRTDLIMRNSDGELELVDFKAREHGGVERLMLEYQLRVYQYALRDRYRFDRLSAYVIKDSERISFDPDEEFNVKDRINSAVEGIRSESFEPRRNQFCSHCVFMDFCGL